jgi:hypothetical protein
MATGIIISISGEGWASAFWGRQIVLSCGRGRKEKCSNNKPYPASPSNHAFPSRTTYAFFPNRLALHLDLLEKELQRLWRALGYFSALSISALSLRTSILPASISQSFEEEGVSPTMRLQIWHISVRSSQISKQDMRAATEQSKEISWCENGGRTKSWTKMTHSWWQSQGNVVAGEQPRHLDWMSGRRSWPPFRFTVLEVAAPTQKLDVDIDMLSPDFYTIVTSSGHSTAYNATASNSHGEHRTKISFSQIWFLY